VGLILDTMQLASALGCSDSAITAQVQKGMPRLRAGRRGKPALFDFDQVRAWCAKTGFGTRIDVLTRAQPAASPGTAPRPDVCTTLPAAILAAATEWLQDAHAAGFCDPEPAPSVADLADLGELFIAKLADALEAPLGAEFASSLRAAVHPMDSTPESLDQALAKFKPRSAQSEASHHG
jgi:hypothetical protein